LKVQEKKSSTTQYSKANNFQGKQRHSIGR
jgi:hypothetical protein